MSILDRSALEQSPLADLHAIASELSLDGYRRLRKPALIDAILERQGGDGASGTTAAEEADEAAAGGDEDATPTRRRRGRRGGRGRGAGDGEPEEERPARRRRAPAATEDEEPRAVEEPEPDASVGGEPLAEGVVEVLPGGSAFLRVHPPEPSDEDIYISAAQVKRCELVSGDRIAGPRRAPRRSERFASLVRVDTINGRPASELADSARFEDLPVGFAVERFRFASEEPTLKAIEFLTPIGRGSRVTIAGPAQAGKSHTLRLLGAALKADEQLEVLVALAGTRPEEAAAWSDEGLAPAAAVTLAGSGDAQSQAVERVLDQARRLTARGNHVVVLIDSLSGLPPAAARRALAAARRIVDAGSLTVIATASELLGGETTAIVLDAALTAAGRFPAVDVAASWTMHPELLVGDSGAEMIRAARAQALDL
ncbi:MAG TPA: Rho termination factor N-terminal domain-containing protein [Solirubrobacteraceae bacterium]|nr:Rho termination factor N-terminal domain-containing protein [Solirubrobacteraceae bacterium]